MKRLLLALWCASCARDLAVPPLSQRPVITSFAPLSAYADTFITIQGKNFAPVPSNNVVQFLNATSRGDHFSATRRDSTCTCRCRTLDEFQTFQ